MLYYQKKEYFQFTSPCNPSACWQPTFWFETAPWTVQPSAAVFPVFTNAHSRSQSPWGPPAGTVGWPRAPPHNPFTASNVTFATSF